MERAVCLVAASGSAGYKAEIVLSVKVSVTPTVSGAVSSLVSAIGTAASRPLVNQHHDAPDSMSQRARCQPQRRGTAADSRPIINLPLMRAWNLVDPDADKLIHYKTPSAPAGTASRSLIQFEETRT